MSVRQSLLAILNQGPCYGYQLRTEFDRRTGSIWPINVGQVYSTLDRLARDGLVKKGEPDAGGQHFYEITDAGRGEVASWFGSPVQNTSPARDELAIKLALAVTLPGTDAPAVIEVQRASALTSLHELREVRDAMPPPLSSEQLARLLVLDSAVFSAEAEVRWLEHTAARLALASTDGTASPAPLSTDVPKRGRPFKVAAQASAPT